MNNLKKNDEYEYIIPNQYKEFLKSVMVLVLVVDLYYIRWKS